MIKPGSPPLTREEHDVASLKNLETGITPAYAGRTVSVFWHDQNMRDHPRLRGKNCLPASQNSLALGSPPLTREELQTGVIGQFIIRITPAYAGRTTTHHLIFGEGWDHPRLRGKNLKQDPYNLEIIGSPPLTREELRRTSLHEPNTRITPAYAGRTPLFHSRMFSPRDHPRLRGKNFEKMNYPLISRGSPPLTREEPKEEIMAIPDQRITPAYAGRT